MYMLFFCNDTVSLFYFIALDLFTICLQIKVSKLQIQFQNPWYFHGFHNTSVLYHLVIWILLVCKWNCTVFVLSSKICIQVFICLGFCKHIWDVWLASTKKNYLEITCEIKLCNQMLCTKKNITIPTFVIHSITVYT